MTEQDIQDVIDAYVRSAKHAVELGFDGIAGVKVGKAIRFTGDQFIGGIDTELGFRSSRGRATAIKSSRRQMLMNDKSAFDHQPKL